MTDDDSATCRPEVCAVVVTHHPDSGLLAEALAALVPQVGHVVLVDDASADPRVGEACARHPEVVLLALPDNRGLAHALNVGIEQARTCEGVRQVLLLDQDSVPEPGMVAALCGAYASLVANGRSVAAVGATFRDVRERADAPFVRIGFPFNRKLRCGGRGAAIRCDFLITSGCLVPLAVLDAAGGMDEALFIDNVDLDWCFRASAAGYHLYGVCTARMRHHLGAGRKRVPGLPRAIVVHPPMRLHYIMRNRVLLYRRAYTPRRWIAQDLPRLIVKLLLFSLLVAPRWRNLRCMLSGLAAGLAGRTAPPPKID